MAKYIKEVEIDAVQFTGHNWKTVQDFVGKRNLDPSGQYSFPLFDDANIWLPNRTDPEGYPAVVQIRGTWQLVKAGDWIVREPGQDFIYTLMSNDQFVATYGEPVQAAKKTTSRRKTK